jgi:hypothetical protein
MIINIGGNKYFQTIANVNHTWETAIIWNIKCIFNVTWGRHSGGGVECKNHYCIMIDSQDSYDKVTRERFTFGSHLYADFGEAAEKICRKIAKEKGFEVNKILGHWPIFNALLIDTKGIEKLDTRPMPLMNNGTRVRPYGC